MIVLASKDNILEFLLTEVRCWEKVGGGPNLDAFDFDPEQTDPKLLEELGYYHNKEAWLAGIRIKALWDFIREIESLPPYVKKI